jgi:hypothetical protein
MKRLIFQLLLILIALSSSSCDKYLTDDVAIGQRVEDSSDDSSSSSSSDGNSENQEDDDEDGLSNEVEETFLLSVSNSDTDFDGIGDGLELVIDSGDPLDAGISPNPRNRSLTLDREDVIENDLDRDFDGLGDTFERNNGLDELDPDTDDDGYRDGLELVAGSDPFLSTSRPTRANPPMDDGGNRSGQPPVDSDGDGLSDSFESLNGTFISSADSDSDGFSDGIEFLMGSSALDQASVPNFIVPERP